MGRALVVEDHEPMLEAFRDLLEDAGYAVFVARDGVEALSVLRREAISVVVLDIGLPTMDGRAFRERQLEDPRLASVPVIVVTADPRAEMEGVCLMRKPFDSDALLAEMDRAQRAAPDDDATNRRTHGAG